jgi:hypothetical protein
MKAKKKPENVLVVYQTCDETLVCLKKDEKRLIKEFFDDPDDRRIDDYDRYESEHPHPVIIVQARSAVDVSNV